MIDFAKLNSRTPAERAADHARIDAEHAASTRTSDLARRETWCSATVTMRLAEGGRVQMTPDGDSVAFFHGAVEGHPGVDRLEWYLFPWGDDRRFDDFVYDKSAGDEITARGYFKKDGRTFCAQFIEGVDAA